MPKKKVVPQEEPEQAAEPLEQTGTGFPVPPEDLPLDVDAPDGNPPPEMSGLDEPTPLPADDPGVPVEPELDAPEVMAVDVSSPPPEAGLEDGEPFDAVLPADAQETTGVLTEPLPPADELAPAPPEPAPKEEPSPARPRTDCQNFFAMDF